MKQISFYNVNITNGFWKNRQEINRNTTIYAVQNRFADTGRFEAFKFQNKDVHFFWDSDIAKWIEGVAYIIRKHPNVELEKAVEEVIDCIEKYQDKGGYFNIYFTVVDPENRYKRRTDHELYCGGHLIEAAVAYYEVTGKDRFLRLMCKYADHVEKVFKINNSAEFLTCGHQEIELALVRLYRCTGERRYLELSQFFVEQRGNNDKDIGKYYDFANAMYDQSHLPIREQHTAEGHSVRGCYFYCGVADVAKEHNDAGLADACKRLFQDIVNRKMYITGGIGSSHLGEAFTAPYDLPNKTAYAETCATISLIYFAQRMLALEVNSLYSDTIERALYNGMLAGISLDGKSFFYENPLEIDPILKTKDTSISETHRTRFPITQRVEVFECSCCPPNLNRFFASLGDLIYGMQDDTLFVHQYIDSELAIDGISVKQTTKYPNNGKISIKADGIKRLAVRIPWWCDNHTINKPHFIENGYAYIDATNVEMDFAMRPVLMQSAPNVQENGGRVAMQMGPIVYCLEEVDNGKLLRSVSVDKSLNAEIVCDDYFGANVIYADGYRPQATNILYSPLNDNFEKTRLKFIPYFAFANRGESEMCLGEL